MKQAHRVKHLSSVLAGAALALALAACSASENETSVNAGDPPPAPTESGVLDASNCVGCDENGERAVFVWAAGEPGLTRTNQVRITPTENAARLTGVGDASNSGGRTTGAYFTLSGEAEALASGNRIRIEVEVRGDAGQVLPIAYSTADNGNSGWREFELSGEREWLRFHYAVPPIVQGGDDFLGIQPALDESVLLFRTRVMLPAADDPAVADPT